MTAGDRHSSNTNDRGSAEARRKRKNWLLDIWGADVDVVTLAELTLLDATFRDDGLPLWDIGLPARHIRGTYDWEVHKGLGRAACRCFRCGKLVTFETMEVDKIVPKAQKTKRYPNGGTYVRENIRPICSGCNHAIEGEARKRRNAKRKKRNAQARARRRKCGLCGATPATGNAARSELVNGKWVTTWFCHPDEGPSCYSGDTSSYDDIVAELSR